MAVDNLCDGLVKAGVSIVRLGHPSRIQSQLQAYTLDAQVEQHSDYRLAHKMRRDGYALRDKADKWTRNRPEPGERNRRCVMKRLSC